MTAVWIIGILFIVAGYFMGIRRMIKGYRYKEKTEGTMISCENTTGTGKQSLRVSYTYSVDGMDYIGKSEWLNNIFFYPGKKCEIRYDLSAPEKSYLKTLDRTLQSVIGTFFCVVGIGIIILGFILQLVIL